MKDLLFIISFVFVSTYCNAQTEVNSLNFINQVNKLTLIFIDNACGEWGGNEINIMIYRDDFTGPLLADYIERNKNCIPPYDITIGKDLKRINLTQYEKDLILESINDLIISKLNKEEIPSHSGLLCVAKLNNSSFYIEDFPSRDWIKFKLLCTQLNKQ
ncbi:MAG: hypothetical protein ACK4TA_15915 [Saprospiraceae bacterium]